MKKILFITLSNLGDMVLSLPVLESLCRAYPESRVDVIGGRPGTDIFQNDPRIRRFTVFDKKSSWLAKWRFLQEIRSERYDIVVDLRYSLMGLLSGAKMRNRYFRITPLPKHRRLRHLKALDGLAPLWIGGVKLPGAPEWTSAYRARPGKRIVVAPGSKSDVKKWPAVRYAELLDRLVLERDCEIVLVGDKADAADALAVKGAMRHPVRDLTGKTDFQTLCSVVESADMVITNDSAPLHMAQALRVPTLAIFGPTDPLKYGPSAPNSAVVSKGLFCQPCEKAQCRFGTRECLKDLSVEAVYAKALLVMSERVRDEAFRILVVRLDRLGDVVLSIPALKALRERFPQAKISVLARPYTKEILDGQRCVDEVLTYEYEKGGRHASAKGYLQFIRMIRRKQFDAALILHPGIRSYLLTFLSAIPHRIGYRNQQSFLLTQEVEDRRHFGQKHEAQYAMDLVSHVGVYTAGPLDPSLDVNGLTELEIKERLSQEGLGQGERLIAIHPGASCPSKRWPKERFKELIRRLLENDSLKILVIGDRSERRAGIELAGVDRQRVWNWTGNVSLKELPALLKQCALLVSNDSGPVHVAAAVGTRVVSIFGRNQAGLSAPRWRPLGEGHVVLQKDPGCAVCLAHRCPIEFECLKLISVQDAVDAVYQILNEENQPAK